MLFRKLVCYLFGHNSVSVWSANFGEFSSSIYVCERCGHKTVNDKNFVDEELLHGDTQIPYGDGGFDVVKGPSHDLGDYILSQHCIRQNGPIWCYTELCLLTSVLFCV